MVYTTINYKTKKSLKDAVAVGNSVTIYNPGFGTAPKNGGAFLEGQHYPESSKWYSEVVVKDGIVIKVK